MTKNWETKSSHMECKGNYRGTEYIKGNKTVPGKVATTRTEDEHK
jgi:hypothetical protein